MLVGPRHVVADLDKTTLADYGRILARFAAHQPERGRDVLSATEPDLVAYRRWRIQLQERPIATSAWAKESGLLDQFYTFLEKHGHIKHRPVRVAARGRNPLAPKHARRAVQRVPQGRLSSLRRFVRTARSAGWAEF